MPKRHPDDTGKIPAGTQILALIAGLVLAVMGLKSMMQDYRIVHRLTHLDQVYRPTPAKFLRVGERRDTSGAVNAYYPDVLYAYSVRGKSVWGWRFSFEEEPRPFWYWQRRLDRYHVGDTVTAYVNPHDPKDSFVEDKHGNLLRPLLKGAVGLGFFLAGAVLFVIPVMGLIEMASPPRRLKM